MRSMAYLPSSTSLDAATVSTDVDEATARAAADVLRPRDAGHAAGRGRPAGGGLQGARRPDARRHRQPPGGVARGLRVRPDGRVRALAADDLASPPPAPRRRSRRVRAARDVGVLPARAR